MLHLAARGNSDALEVIGFNRPKSRLSFVSVARRGLGDLDFDDIGGKPSLAKDANSTTTFADVVGVDEAKHELEDIVAYLKDPGRFTRLGGKMTKGVLLYGPPGTGKTLLARAVAGEAGVPFKYASGSEFEEKYVGVGAQVSGIQNLSFVPFWSKSFRFISRLRCSFTSPLLSLSFSLSLSLSLSIYLSLHLYL